MKVNIVFQLFICRLTEIGYTVVYISHKRLWFCPYDLLLIVDSPNSMSVRLCLKIFLSYSDNRCIYCHTCVASSSVRENTSILKLPRLTSIRRAGVFNL